MELISIPEAAAKYGVDVKRLRGKVWLENQTGKLDQPIGCFQSDMVYDDWRLQKLAGSVAGSETR